MSKRDATTAKHPGTIGSGSREADQNGAAQPPQCVSCRLDAELEMGGVWLCLNCYHVAGSTCAGISRPSDGTGGEVC